MLSWSANHWGVKTVRGLDNITLKTSICELYVEIICSFSAQRYCFYLIYTRDWLKKIPHNLDNEKDEDIILVFFVMYTYIIIRSIRSIRRSYKILDNNALASTKH